MWPWRREDKVGSGSVLAKKKRAMAPDAKRAKLEGSRCENFINGESKTPNTGKYMDIESPSEGRTIGQVGISDATDVNDAVQAAQTALPSWRALTLKARASIMFKFHELLTKHAGTYIFYH